VINLSDKMRSYKSEILGWGYRMTELEAAICIAQLSKLDSYNEQRIKLAGHLTEKLKSIDGIKHVKFDFVRHVYYVYAFSYDADKIGIPREKFCEAVRAEGIPIYGGYVKPLYLNPLYLEKRAFAYKHYNGTAKYEKGICPVAESLHENDLVMIPVCRPPATTNDMDDIINAIHKVIENKDEMLGEC